MVLTCTLDHMDKELEQVLSVGKALSARVDRPNALAHGGTPLARLVKLRAIHQSRSFFATGLLRSVIHSLQEPAYSFGIPKRA